MLVTEPLTEDEAARLKSLLRLSSIWLSVPTFLLVLTLGMGIYSGEPLLLVMIIALPLIWFMGAAQDWFMLFSDWRKGEKHILTGTIAERIDKEWYSRLSHTPHQDCYVVFEGSSYRYSLGSASLYPPDSYRKGARLRIEYLPNSEFVFSAEIIR
ncbi:MAG: hypothetical protein MUD08_01370 [Cytophagales bacterium]|jgi:hypothetical protein|nr:hypothetical protein [Cytophagales bacterium]